MLTWLFRLLKNALKAAALFMINFYQVFLSPQIGFGCRFQPTCSEFAKDCFKNGNFFWAFGKTFNRLCKCHPFGEFGYDPAPQMKENSK